MTELGQEASFLLFNLNLTQILGLLAIGVFVGFSSSIFGLGGGVLITPLLPLVVVLPHREVVATSLSCILLVVSVNVYYFIRSKLVDLKLSLVYGSLASIGAVIGAVYSRIFTEVSLKWMTAIVLIVLGLILVTPKKKKKITVSEPKSRLWILSPFGFIAGGFSGLTGVGTGALLGPLFFASKLTKPNMVSPTANGVLILTAFFAVMAFSIDSYKIGQGFTGAFNGGVVLFIFSSAVVSSILGRRWQNVLPEEPRKKMMAIISFTLAVVALIPVFTGWGLKGV